MHYRQGWYYLFYSGDLCCLDDGLKARYATMVARARHPLGPYDRLAGAPGHGTSIVLKLGDRFRAPGHNSVATDAAGQDWLVYHAIDWRHRLDPAADALRRPMLIDRIRWVGGWPQVAGDVPSDGPRPRPAPLP